MSELLSNQQQSHQPQKYLISLLSFKICRRRRIQPNLLQFYYNHICLMHQQGNATAYSSKDSHPILQSYKQVSNKLQQEHSRVKSNELKIQNLAKKVSCLELLNKHSQKQTMRYQRQLDKLEATQKYATELLKLKYNNFREIEEDNNNRYQHCLTQRTKMMRSRRISQSLFEKKKSDRVKRYREEKERISHDLQRSYRQLENKAKQQTQEVRQQEQRIKERMRRYEVFKMQRAALNYNEKLEVQYERFKEKNRHLSELQMQAHKAQQIFRKTQMLGREADKIQSIYLTDNWLQ